MADEERFDGIFMNIVQQASGIDNFFDSLFGFMRRKTDFFTNADSGKRMISKHFDSHLELFTAQKEREEEVKKAKAAKAEREKKPEPVAMPAPPKPAAPKVMEVTDEEAEAIQTGGELPPKPEESKEEPKAAEPEGPALVGNGGRTDKYIWTQTLSDISVNIFVPEGVPSKQIRVNCTPTHLTVIAAGQEVVAGQLHKRVKPDELVWKMDTVEGRRCVALDVEKHDGMNWWSCILEGEAEIDTKKIVPENSKLSDLDGEMRSTVEKMMVDQQRKAAGLPSTEEEQKQEMLKKFMKAHPEMDFSKAKFS